MNPSPQVVTYNPTNHTLSHTLTCPLSYTHLYVRTYIQATLLLVDIVENALLDLVTWLEDMVEALRALPRPNKIPGKRGMWFYVVDAGYAGYAVDVVEAGCGGSGVCGVCGVCGVSGVCGVCGVQ